ncbi:MAG: UDP binding domain-containing protein, partial [Sedimenticola sp.]
ILGLTFKENCPDLRNTRIVDIIEEFNSYNAAVDVYDPWVNHQEAEEEYGITPIEKPQPGTYDAVVMAVAHREFVEMGSEAIRALGKEGAVLYDVKSLFPASEVDGRL